MHVRLVKLKIKIKSLAEEARIIKLEERKLKEQGRHDDINTLHKHRTYDVRNAARETLIVYGYIRGLPYASIEKNPVKPPNVLVIRNMLKKHGTMEERNGFSAWFEGTDTPIKIVESATAVACFN